MMPQSAYNQQLLLEAYAELIESFKIDELVLFMRRFGRDATRVTKCADCDEPFCYHDRASCLPVFKQERNNEP